MVELWFQVEKEIGLDVPHDQAECSTLGDVPAYIDQLHKQQTGKQRDKNK